MNVIKMNEMNVQMNIKNECLKESVVSSIRDTRFSSPLFLSVVSLLLSCRWGMVSPLCPCVVGPPFFVGKLSVRSLDLGSSLSLCFPPPPIFPWCVVKDY